MYILQSQRAITLLLPGPHKHHTKRKENLKYIFNAARLNKGAINNCHHSVCDILHISNLQCPF